MLIDLGVPNPKQKLFLQAKKRFIAFGGARGGGKSWVVRAKATAMALKHGGIKILVMRRTLAELRSNHIIPLLQLTQGIAMYSDLHKELRFSNGSVIMFGYCDNDRDLLRYQGNEYDVVFIDEATQFQFEWFSALCGSVRGVNNFPKRVYLTCNPGGIGHVWVRRLFVDKIYEEGEEPEDYEFIQSLVTDNQILMENDPGYVKFLKSLYPTLRAAWLEGDWDAFSGRYFKDFDPSIHVLKPFDISRFWRRYIAFDYGLDMFACLWIAVDSALNAIVYREICMPNLIISRAAEVIKNTGDYHGMSIYAPPDMWNRRQDTGKSAAEIFTENGIPVRKAKNDRVLGWMNLSEWLAPYENELGETDAKLKIFDTCPELIRSLRNLNADENKPDDVATEPHELTHACVTGDTKVRLPYGTKTIKELVGTQGEIVSHRVDKTVTMRYNIVSKTRENAPVYKLTTESGAVFRATADHRVLTKDGWKQLCELIPGEQLVSYTTE